MIVVRFFLYLVLWLPFLFVSVTNFLFSNNLGSERMTSEAAKMFIDTRKNCIVPRPIMVSVTESITYGIKQSALRQDAASKDALITINAPGIYSLIMDLVALPINDFVSIIRINTNNVYLDLAGRTIRINDDNTATGTIGIEIASGVRNVTITNGFIDGFGKKGKMHVGMKMANNSNVFIGELIISGCGSSGFDANLCVGIHLERFASKMNNDYGDLRAEVLAGAKFTACRNCSIKGGDFSGNIVSGQKSNVSGLYLDKCVNFEVANVYSEINESLENCQGTCGFRLYNCENCNFTDCCAIGNRAFGANSKAVGFSIVESSSNKFTRCLSNSNKHESSVAVSSAYGFYFKNSDINELVGCEAERNRSHGINSADSVGFKFDECKGSSIKKCKSTSNYINSSATRLSEAIGFLFANGSYNSLDFCDSKLNLVATPYVSGSIAAGIVLSGEQASSVTNCNCSNNVSLGGTGVGILIINGTAGTASDGCSIVSNKLFSNKGAGLNSINGTYGFKDASLESTSFLHSNIAFNQGVTFSGPNTREIVDDGRVNFFVKYAAGVLTDISKIIKETNVADLTTFATTSFFNYSINKVGEV